MRYPDFIKKGNTVGFVAPSYGCAIEPYRTAFDNALSRLRDIGYVLKLGPNCYLNRGIGISNTPDRCGAELNTMYTGDDCDCIISCGGGELMCEVVPYIDFDMIEASRPKWYMGYSDNTNFTFLSAILSDTASIYGPCAAAFGMEPWHESIRDALSVLTGEASSEGVITFTGYDKWELESIKDETNPLVPYNTTEQSRIITVPKGDITMTGRLIGGCIDCLINLIGTPYDKVGEFTKHYASDGILWFLEACDLSPMDIRRAMWHMKEAGWFKNASGFIIGRPGRYGEEMLGLDTYHAVVDIISDLHVPVLLDADIGHHPPMIPVICGSVATVRTTGNTYSIEMRLV